MNITAISIDDEPGAHAVIEHHASKIEELDLIETFTSPVKALDYLRDHDVDLLFLDINMPDIDGMTLLKTLKNPPDVIFTTAYDEYAVESYDFQASGYLLKPIGFPKFYQAVMRVLDQKKSQRPVEKSPSNSDHSSSLMLKSGNKVLKFSAEDILYIKASGNYAEIYLQDESVLVDHTLSDLQEHFLPSSFVRIHRSYIINMNYLQEYESHQVRLNDILLPIGKTYRKEMQTHISLL